MDLETVLERALARQLNKPDPDAPRADRPRLAANASGWQPAFIAAAVPALDALLCRATVLSDDMTPLGPVHARFGSSLNDRVLAGVEADLSLWLDRLSADYPPDDEVDWTYAGAEIGAWWAHELPSAFERLIRPGLTDEIPLEALLAEGSGHAPAALAEGLAIRQAATLGAAAPLWALLKQGETECPRVTVGPRHTAEPGAALLGQWQPNDRSVTLASELFLARYAAGHPPIDSPQPGSAWATVGEPCLALLRTGLIAPGRALLHELGHAAMPHFALPGEVIGRVGDFEIRGLALLGPEDPRYGRARYGHSSELHEAVVEALTVTRLAAAQSLVQADIWSSPPTATVPAFRRWGRPAAGYPAGPALIGALLAGLDYSLAELVARPDQLQILLARLPVLFAPADATAFRAWLIGGPSGDWPLEPALQQRYWLERAQAQRLSA